MTGQRKLISFDWAMKYLLRNKAHFAILEGFLSELLGKEVVIQELLESESNRRESEDKFNRVDLLAKMESKELVLIEVQCEREIDYLSRLLYGTSRLVLDHIKLGEPYIQIKKVISVSLLYFNLGLGKDYLYRGTTQFVGIHEGDFLHLQKREVEAYQQAGHSLSFPSNVSVLYPEYYLLRINQFSQQVRDKLDEWFYFFQTEEIRFSFQAKGIQQARQDLDLLKLSSKERQQYQAYFEQKSYESSMVLSHYGQGLEEGKREGRQEEKRELAKRLLKIMEPEKVARLTELSLKEVKELQ